MSCYHPCARCNELISSGTVCSDPYPSDMSQLGWDVLRMQCSERLLASLVRDARRDGSPDPAYRQRLAHSVLEFSLDSVCFTDFDGLRLFSREMCAYLQLDSRFTRILGPHLTHLFDRLDGAPAPTQERMA